MEYKIITKEKRENSKPFVYDVACFFCNKTLNWSSDAELNVAFLAFNRAFESQLKIECNHFGYAYALINSALLQYYIKLDTTPNFVFSHENKPYNDYLDKLSDFETYFENNQRAMEIALLSKALKKYSIKLTKLKLNDIELSNILLNLSISIFKNEVLTSDILVNNKYNKNELTPLTCLEWKKIKKYKKYILMLLILFSSEDYLYLKSFLSIKVGATSA